MANTNSKMFLFCMLALFNCGAFLFLIGFFPDAVGYDIKEDTSNISKDSRPRSVNGLSVTPSQRQYDQIILMIVDALRFDFIANMNASVPFTHSKRCNLLKLRVSIPTVTMPRIKSLMTGKLSNFIDIIRNLGEVEQLTDSLIHMLKKRGHMVNFAGDRTWTQLFPFEFDREAANLDSFYVRDFYEGDMLIQETLKDEITETDWSFFILHFLGLDHIGHVEGSNSDKIPPKLLEMDTVIRNICENTLFEKRLLLVTGDHGMRNGGGHGGSTEEEIKVPLVFFNKICKRNESPKKEYNQIDVTPTLAILFSVEIPQPSIGCLIPELLVSLTYEEKLYAYFYNAHHLLNKAIAKYGENDVENSGYYIWYTTATMAHRQFLEAKMKNSSAVFHYEQAIADYKRLADNISSRISASLVSFDNVFIGIGIFNTTTVTIYTLFFLLYAKRGLAPKKSMINIKLSILSLSLSIITITISYNADLITMDTNGRMLTTIIFLATGIYITLRILKILQQLLLPLEDTSPLYPIWIFPIPPTICCLLTVIVLISTSFIEYEKYSCHYLGCSCLLVLIVQVLFQRLCHDFDMNNSNLFKNRLKLAMLSIAKTLPIMLILRVLYLTNIKSESEDSQIKLILHRLLMESYFPLGLLLLLIQYKRLITTKQLIFSILATVFVFSFRLLEGHFKYLPSSKFSSFFVLVLFWCCVALIALLGLQTFFKYNGHIHFLKTYIVCFLLIAALLHKPQNVILLPFMLIVLDKTYGFCDYLMIEIFEPYKQNYILAYKTLVTILVANMFFFYQGNSNSLATIDLNPGYVGQSTYNPIVAAIFLTINTYSSPMLAFYKLTLHILQSESQLIETSTIISGSTKSMNENLFQRVLALYTTATIFPAAVYLGFMILFRYHLFIYSVFAPKFFYECYNVIVFSINYCVINLFLYLFKKV